MANKEKLKQLTEYIEQLKKLTESIYQREIYPVSFFSEAFDITNKIQDSLHRIETSQIELFERQMKEHQAQIRSLKHTEMYREATPDKTVPVIEEKEPEFCPLPEKHEPVTTKEEPSEKETEINKHKEVILLSIEEKLQTTGNPLEKKLEKKILADFKKAITLNDRFRFCRELFSSDENLMNQTFTELKNRDSYEDSMAFIKENFNWDWEEQTVSEFITLIEKRFN